MMTGKNKKQFEEWFLNKEHEFIEDQEFWNFGIFYNLPFNMQIGVYLAYYDSLDITIIIQTFDYFFYSTIEEGSFVSDDYITRNEAYKEAFKEADKIANNQLNK